MLSFPPTVRVFVVVAPRDMRGSFDALAGAVRHLGLDPVDSSTARSESLVRRGLPAPALLDHHVGSRISSDAADLSSAGSGGAIRSHRRSTPTR